MLKSWLSDRRTGLLRQSFCLIEVLTFFGAYLRMVYEFIDTSFVSLNIKSACAENLFDEFYQLHFSHD